MKKMNRRSFLKRSAAVAGASAAIKLLPTGWYNIARADSPAYFETEFGISDSLCNKVLAEALSKGGDFADLFFEHSITNQINLEDGQVNRAYSQVDLGVGIRTVKGEQVGYGFTQDLKEKAILAAAGVAATIADTSSSQPAGEFVLIQKGNYYPLQTLLTDIPLESKLPLVEALNEQCFNRSSLIIKVMARYFDQQKRIMIFTSEGIKVDDLLPRNFLEAKAVAEKDGQRESARWNIGGRWDFSSYTPQVVEKISQETIDRVTIAFEAVQSPAGEMPVVLGAGAPGVLLHEAIGHGMEADFNRKNISTYATMIGKKVAEPFVNIVDDGTLPHVLGSLNVDDEGTPGQKTVLVENGILTRYMHDKISANFYKVKTTGNGRRESYQHYVQPRMRNTYMLSGPATLEDLVKSVDKGIYVQNVSNGQVKIGEGDFAFYVSQGRMIENGKLTSPIKDVNIMGNGPKMLQNVIMVANDLQIDPGGSWRCGKGGQSVPVSLGMPSVLVKSMTVGGSKA